MIVVMDSGYATRPGGNTESAVTPDFSAFEDVMVSDVIPMIDADFRTIPDPSHRAMAGLSMGANQALRIATHHLDLFGYMGGFSGTMNGLSADVIDPATAFDGVFKDGKAFNEKSSCCGWDWARRSRASLWVPSAPSARCSTSKASAMSSTPRPGPRTNG